jgi:hypothetical protein
VATDNGGLIVGIAGKSGGARTRPRPCSWSGMAFGGSALLTSFAARTGSPTPCAPRGMGGEA